MHPASVTKIATTLALLRRFGPAHRFVTRVVATGPLHDGTAAGDLVVEGGGDPFFVTENALLVLSELEARGLRRVAGSLRIRGPFLFNWQPDEQGSGSRGVPGPRAGERLVGRVRGASRRGEPRRATAGLRFLGRGTPAEPDDPGLVLTHRSPALVLMLKSLNCYSNNVFHLLSDRVGGPHAVEETAARSLLGDAPRRPSPSTMRPARARRIA
jgi:D-alanyl-D-alanine carboxypeptidase/D-alanyl-D-alanine-endopeptidase (penicillin-binding protein 4)